MKNSPPNVVLIQVDQWRGDCLSIEGHPVVHTPWLDQLALQGVRFPRAYASCPTCIPARASLMTGLSPASHGRVGYLDGVPWDYTTTLAGEFTRHGYQTQAVGKMHVYPERTQLGFQHVLLHDGYLHFARQRRHGDLTQTDDYLPWLRERTGRFDADYFDHGIGCNSSVARPWPYEEYLHPTNWVTSNGIDFFRRRDPRKPFFLYLSYHRPHQPYDPPQWAFDQYLDAPMPAPPVGDWASLLEPYGNGQPDSLYSEADTRFLQRARAGYYGHMTHIDHQINRFLEVLKEYGLEENTWVCFVSDHGEMLGDHNLYRKSYPYEGSARVPLILRGPKGCEVEPGTVNDRVVELRDVMPMLLECAGLPVPGCVEGLNPLAADSWRPYLHGEHVQFGQSLQWLTDGHRKYVWFSGSGHEQLFDLDADPQECHDLAAKPDWRRELEHWRLRLAESLREREEGFSDGKALRTGCPVHPVLSFLREHAVRR
jgi:arylsulfatase A-like enzyme